MPPQVESLLEQGNLLSEKDAGSSRHDLFLGAVAALTQTARRLWQPFASRQTTKLRPTAYLDGMRGFAALLVYILHNETWAHESLRSDTIFENGFGYHKQYYFACFPGIRLLFSGGHLSVAIFFVLSGYVLALKPLRILLINNDHAQLSAALASALFRRWIRLFIPLIITSFIFMTLNYIIPNLSKIKPENAYHDEAFKWYAEFKEFSFIFRMGGEPWFTYNFHSWTIPFEFKGSIAVYTSLLAFSRCTKATRLWCQIGLIWYFLYVVDGWYLACFIAGMLLCELDILATSQSLPKFFTRCQPYKKSIFWTLFIAGIYLGGVPAHSLDVADVREAPGWYYLSFLKPQAALMPKAFYLFWAALFITASVPHLPWLQAFFELRFIQFLGKVSYGLYLVHGPVLWSVGDRVYAAVGWTREEHATTATGWVNAFPLPRFGPLGLEFNFVMAQIILFPITLWLAKVVTTCVDEPSIRFSQWAYKQVVQEIEEPKKSLKSES